jgi:hypothetical protein
MAAPEIPAATKSPRPAAETPAIMAVLHVRDAAGDVAVFALAPLAAPLPVSGFPKTASRRFGVAAAELLFVDSSLGIFFPFRIRGLCVIRVV